VIINIWSEKKDWGVEKPKLAKFIGRKNPPGKC